MPQRKNIKICSVKIQELKNEFSFTTKLKKIREGSVTDITESKI